MASTQETYLKAIADAIRAKEGSTGTIQASKFAERISNLKTEDPKVNFVQIDMPGSIPKDNWWSVAYGGGKFVAVPFNANGKIVAYSYDGMTWNTATTPVDGILRSIVYGNNKFVAVGYYGNSTVGYSSRCIYSTNGITWTKATIPVDAEWRSVTYGAGKFVAIANNSNYAAYSTDGITWTQSTLPASDYWHAIAYSGSGKFVVTGGQTSKAVAYSTDGITWTQLTLPFSLVTQWNSIAYGNGKFVAVGGSGGPSNGILSQCMYSTDGINWNISDIPSAVWMSIAYLDDKFWAIAPDTSLCAYSEDGINWNLAKLPHNGKWYDITYGNGKFVAVSMTIGLACGTYS